MPYSAPSYVLGLETTCDETAAAVVADGRVVASSAVRTQIDLHAKYGGVVPEIASRAHLECLNAVVQEALDRSGIAPRTLSAIAVAHGPGLIGCLIIGVSAAKGFSFAWNLPLVAVNHVQAHLYSVQLHVPDAPPPAEVQFPALGLVISGGHTSLYRMDAFDALTRLGATADDAIGEAFDKVAAILQLGHPGGPLVDKLARAGNPHAVAFPIPLLGKESLDLSYSGLKTAVLYHVNGRQGREKDASALSEQQKADVAASFQEAATQTLVIKCRRAAAQFRPRALVIGGGVSANSAVRGKMHALAAELSIPLFLPAPQFCTDNAAMIAGLGHLHLQANRTSSLDLEAVATM